MKGISSKTLKKKENTRRKIKGEIFSKSSEKSQGNVGFRW